MRSCLAVKYARVVRERDQLRAQLTPPRAPSLRGFVTTENIRDLVAGLFPAGPGALRCPDRMCDITAISELRRFIAWDNVNLFPFFPETHDCDDYAAALWGDFAKYPEWSGQAVALTWSQSLEHAFLLAAAWPSFNDLTPRLFYLEPQSDWEVAAEVFAGQSLDLAIMH